MHKEVSVKGIIIIICDVGNLSVCVDDSGLGQIIFPQPV